ncbi:MAG TPA: O-antigen ligase family protein [Burkholderiaceae bacterium]|nr:O-antigen ligase family protein [Burkholderiaceae bacterium]
MPSRAERVERVLWIACPVLLFVMMFGHTTAIVNLALVLVLAGNVAAACSPARPSPGQWPLMLPMAVWAAWALASVAWSAHPEVSLHAWLDEVVYPALVFWGFWLLGTRLRRPGLLMLVPGLACALLAAMSAIHWGLLQPPTPDTFPLRFYNRVGHTSTLAVFAMPLFAGLLFHRRWKILGIAGIACCLFIGLATLNRFFWPAAVVTLLVALLPLYRRHVLLVLSATLIVGVLGLSMLEFSSRLRLDVPAPALVEPAGEGDGLLELLSRALVGVDKTLLSDARPRFWEYYVEVGMRNAWIGVGFGKPLPGMAYRDELPDDLSVFEPYVSTHAHNLFLNTWLQTGFVGLALQLVLLASLAWQFRWHWRASDWWAPAGLALVAGMLTKNLTDDFMWKTTMLAFWAFAGLLLGLAQCAGDHRASGIVAAGTSQDSIDADRHLV